MADPNLIKTNNKLVGSVFNNLYQEDDENEVANF